MFNNNSNTVSISITKSKPKKCCLVCNDDNSVFRNYDGLSCKSCKKFFLRNAFNVKLKCRDGNSANKGKCRLDKEYRRYCRLCRLKKCLEIGMKKELIFASSKQALSQRETQNLSKAEKVLESTSTVSTINNNPFKLNDYEKQWISIVQKATSVFNISPHYKVVGQPMSILEAINISEMFGRKYVEFCKNLPQFKAIDIDEQLLLLKAAFPETFSINIAFSYDPKERGFPVMVNEEGTRAYFIRANSQRESGTLQIVQTNFWSRFIDSMHLEMENDTVIRDLIFAMLLFKERKTVIRCLEMTRYQYSVYCHLLKRYLQSKYGNEMTAEMKHNSLMYFLGQIDGATETILSVFKLIDDTTQIVHVVAEIYNLY